MRQVGLWASIALIAAISAFAFVNLGELVNAKTDADEQRLAGYGVIALALGHGLRAHFIGEPYRRTDLARMLRRALANAAKDGGNG
jgi:hypothetical protein